jgi:hypothetical protein
MAEQNQARRRARRSGCDFRGVIWPLVIRAAFGAAGAVQRTFRPDTAHWFVYPAGKPR